MNFKDFSIVGSSPEILINEISENYFEDIDFKVNDIHNIINLANSESVIVGGVQLRSFQ